jgi:hypothetical protein
VLTVPFACKTNVGSSWTDEWSWHRPEKCALQTWAKSAGKVSCSLDNLVVPFLHDAHSARQALTLNGEVALEARRRISQSCMGHHLELFRDDALARPAAINRQSRGQRFAEDLNDED